MVRAGDGEHNVRFTIVISSFDQLSMGPSEVEVQSYPRTRSAISPVPMIRLDFCVGNAERGGRVERMLTESPEYRETGKPHEPDGHRRVLSRQAARMVA